MSENSEKMRLQKYLALCGVASRRSAESLIFSKRVKVNGQTVDDIIMVSDQDIIQVDGQLVKRPESYSYFAFNKPYHVVTTMKDNFGRKTVSDYFSHLDKRVYPVGRLDYDSAGLLFMTDDGDFANYLMHPKNEVSKTYRINGKGAIMNEMKNRLEKGIDIGGYVTNKAVVTNVRNNDDLTCTVDITIKEGKNRQVRRMFQAVGITVTSLERISIGEVHVTGIEKGSYRVLEKQEIESLGYGLDGNKE